MSWADRVLGAALGAVTVGLVFGLIGRGPERVAIGLLLVVAATLLGALLDEYVVQRRSVATTRSAPQPRFDAAAAPTEPRHLPAAEELPGRQVAEPATIVREEFTTAPRSAERLARELISPPPPRWVEANPPRSEHTSARWVEARGLDLRATYAPSTESRDRFCGSCGRTVASPAGEPPDDCPFPAEPAQCVVRPSAHRLVTRLRAGRDGYRSDKE